MSSPSADFWTDDTSVFFSSFWGWTPEMWGCVGWTGEQGRTRRSNLKTKLSNPFIAVIYVTKSADDEDLAGKIVGFYLMSHEEGDRNEFTHPHRHTLEPEKWNHSLRALRAFTYIPECRIEAADFDPELARRARPVTKWGEVLTDRKKIKRLRNTPWVEVDVYIPTGQAVETEEELIPRSGFNRAGPANRNGYVVSSSAHNLKRQLYILRLSGNMNAFLDRDAHGRQIYKIGLSASPEMRRLTLQSAMPNGAFRWEICHHSQSKNQKDGYSFYAAVAGEYAMKKALAKSSEWLGGEFYLANPSDIKGAWKLGEQAALNYQVS
jgi:hypothetical protein